MGIVKRIFRYVVDTRNFGILYESVQDFILFGYTDSDWGGSLDDQRSTSGSFFTLGSGAVN